MFDKIKRLFSKQQNNSAVRYAIYQYVQSRSGKWRWRKRAELDRFINPEEIEDWPEDGYYQLREISEKGTKVLWTVYVEQGEVVEYDPELPSNTIQIQSGQQDPTQQIMQAIQHLKMQKQLLEELGLIKDPKREMLETLTMLKELEEIKTTAKNILGKEEDLKDAPWWAKMMISTMSMLPQMQMQMQMYQQYTPQTAQPQQQQDDLDIDINLDVDENIVKKKAKLLKKMKKGDKNGNTE